MKEMLGQFIVYSSISKEETCLKLNFVKDLSQDISFVKTDEFDAQTS